MKRYGRLITCIDCGVQALGVRGGNFVKVGDNQYRHADSTLCASVKAITEREKRKHMEEQAKQQGIVIPKQRGLVVARRKL